MQLRDDFAKHVSELHNPIERPYSKEIDNKLFNNIKDVEHLNKEIANVNPDYLTFLPAYFWVFYFVVGFIFLLSCSSLFLLMDYYLYKVLIYLYWFWMFL